MRLTQNDSVRNVIMGDNPTCNHSGRLKNSGWQLTVTVTYVYIHAFANFY